MLDVRRLAILGHILNRPADAGQKSQRVARGTSEAVRIRIVEAHRRNDVAGVEDLVRLGVANLAIAGRARARVHPWGPEQSVAAANDRFRRHGPGETAARRELLLRGIALKGRRAVLPCIHQPAFQAQSGRRRQRVHGGPIEGDRQTVLRFAHAGLVLVAHAGVQRELPVHAKVVLQVTAVVADEEIEGRDDSSGARRDAEQEGGESAPLRRTGHERVLLRPRLREVEIPARLIRPSHLDANLAKVRADLDRLASEQLGHGAVGRPRVVPVALHGPVAEESTRIRVPFDRGVREFLERDVVHEHRGEAQARQVVRTVRFLSIVEAGPAVPQGHDRRVVRDVGIVQGDDIRSPDLGPLIRVGERTDSLPVVRGAFIVGLGEEQTRDRIALADLVLDLRIVLIRPRRHGNRALLVRGPVGRAHLGAGRRQDGRDVASDGAHAIGRDDVAGKGVARVRAVRQQPRRQRIVDDHEAAVPVEGLREIAGELACGRQVQLA